MLLLLLLLVLLFCQCSWRWIKRKIAKWIYFPLDIDNVKNCPEIEMFPRAEAFHQKQHIEYNSNNAHESCECMPRLCVCFLRWTGKEAHERIVAWEWVATLEKHKHRNEEAKIWENAPRCVLTQNTLTHSLTHTRSSEALSCGKKKKMAATPNSKWTESEGEEESAAMRLHNAHSTGTGCEWETYFMHSSFRKTIIQLHAVSECKINSKHLIYGRVCVCEVCVCWHNQIELQHMCATLFPTIAIMGTISRA